MGVPQTIDSAAVRAALERVTAAILERHRGRAGLWLLGIANGGVPVAASVARRLQAGGLSVALGTVDISFHRDDIHGRPIPKEFTPTFLPGDVDGATVILVDDVLFTGRTVKAALDELFDHGRPGRVELAVLADRGGRTLPIAADYVGLSVAAAADETVIVRLTPTEEDAAISVTTARNL